MRISSTSFSASFLNQVSQLEQQQNTLQEESSSGLKVTQPGDDPAVMSEVLNQQTASAQAAQYQSNITQLQNTATNSGSAMNSLQTLVSQATDLATTAANGTTSATQLSAYASQVASLIQQAVQLGNTQDADGNYIFGGTDSQTKPFTVATDSSGNITGVTYNGNSDVAQSDTGLGSTVSAQVPGVNTTGSGPSGLFADSRTGADLFSHLISLQQNLASGNTTAISSTDLPDLTKDDDNIIGQIRANGVVQSTLTAASNIAGSQTTNLATQISGETNADLAQTLTQLDQTQTAYQAALESGTQIMGLSLLNYLQ